jgi:hypothetical protein
MKNVIISFFIFLVAANNAFATENNAVFDAKGRKVFNSTVPLDLNKQNVFDWNVYFVIKKRPSNHKTRNFSVVQESLLQNRTRWFEVNKNEYIKICPLNFTEKGTWLLPFQAELDSLNCLCLFTDEFTRSAAALYIPDTSNKNLIDTNWILINQKIVNLSKGSHRVFYGKKIPSREKRNPESGFRNVSLSQDLIVDATEFSIGEAEWLNQREYDGVKSIGRKNWPFETTNIYHYANVRSIWDGLDSVYKILPIEQWRKTSLPFIEKRLNDVVVIDTSANGYRIPFYEEWGALQQAGSQDDFFWGNDNLLSGVVTKYEQIFGDSSRSFCYASGEKDPNPFGLYDVYGNALEYVLIKNDASENYSHALECRVSQEYDQSPACQLFFKMVKVEESKQKKICEGTFNEDGTLIERCSPYKQKKYVKGFRLVRKLK